MLVLVIFYKQATIRVVLSWIVTHYSCNGMKQDEIHQQLLINVNTCLSGDVRQGIHFLQSKI